MSIISEQLKWFKIFNRMVDRIVEIIVLATPWIVFSFIILLLSGFRSNSLAAWVVAIFVAPLLYVAGEMFVEFFRGIKPVKIVRESIDEQTEGKSLSGIRISYLLIESLILLGILAGCWLVVSKFFFK
ncbi:MAG: hypothetical protein A2157_12825 [Deltaproteobacteria bacterium RBG_16_47_11]|nr:MAG: hypothetical protein A2157_12825 [Deltaproteobacteria bacterium RBG_16_47_11]